MTWRPLTDAVPKANDFVVFDSMVIQAERLRAANFEQVSIEPNQFLMTFAVVRVGEVYVAHHRTFALDGDADVDRSVWCVR